MELHQLQSSTDSSWKTETLKMVLQLQEQERQLLLQSMLHGRFHKVQLELHKPLSKITRRLRLPRQPKLSPLKLPSRSVISPNGLLQQIAMVLISPGLLRHMSNILQRLELQLQCLAPLEHGTSLQRRMQISPKTSKSKRITRLIGSSKRNLRPLPQRLVQPWIRLLLVTRTSTASGLLLVPLQPFLELLQSSLASLPQCSEQLS